MKSKFVKLNKFFTALAIVAGLASQANSAPNAGFNSAKEIPAPQRVGLNTSLNASPVSTGSTSQQFIQLPKQSLTQPRMVTEKIRLDEVSLKQQNVLISNDDTHLVNVSQSLVNRISTPFRNPTVMTNGGANFQVIGQDVYIEMNSDQPIGVYVREDEEITNNSPVASLTLIPKAIPSQNVTLVLDQSVRDRASSKNVKLASDYEDGLRASLSKAVLGDIPDGFSRSNSMNKSIAKIGPVMLRPKNMLSGVDQNIFVYTAENTSSQAVELVEASFHYDGVRAVAFYPEIRLAPNQKTNVYILADVGEASVND